MEDTNCPAYNKSTRRKVDVICLHTREGKIKPMRIRLIDEDGLPQSFDIKGVLDHSHPISQTMPDGMYVTDETLIFECKISVLNRERIIMLYYNRRDDGWIMTD